MSENATRLDDRLHWYKDAIIYELHIKAFRDGNGDGIGDFEGLLQKLDYLEDLGVTAIWVLPFYPSPLRDDGYDIADYYTINSSYGNIEEFKRFLNEAHKRNLKVITELVINHTSDQHPWFQRARLAPKGSVERDYYVWSDDPQKYEDVRIIFQDFESSNWTWDAVAGQYYWHRFFYHQPDLNYDNPAVQEEVFKIIDYWCDMGVDGFRLDAVPYLFERENTNGENLPETHAYLKKLRAHVDEKYPGTVLLAEANMWPEDSASYFGDGDECHMNYHFPVMPRMFMALQMEDRYPITDIFYQTPKIPETCQWAIFLRNHDELTLEMVTDEERDYMYKVYAKDPKARINLGIRHRLAPLMENNRRKIELMNFLLFSLEGTPVLYYGDEIGMGDNFYLGDRDGVRTPMQWTPDRNAGFSEANPQQLYLPVILDPEYQYEAVNVENQRRNPSSLLWFMKRLIQMRKKYKAFSRGSMTFINVENPKILAFVRKYQEEQVLVIVNLSRYSQPAQLELGDYLGYIPVEIVSKNRFPPIRDEGNYFFPLSPYACQFFELEKVMTAEAEIDKLPEISLDRWEDLLVNAHKKYVEQEILPEYFSKSKWFKTKEREIRNLHIIRGIQFSEQDNEFYFLLVEVNFQTGLPGIFHLPVVFLPQKTAGRFSDTYPQALIALMKLGATEGILVDAFYTSSFHQMVVKKFLSNQIIQQDRQVIRFQTRSALDLETNDLELKSKILPVSDGYISIGIDNRYFLKFYRHVDSTINSDLELTRYLSETAGYEQVPQYLGKLEWESGKEVIALGMLQTLVEYHGNGYTYMLERLNNYFERITARENHPAINHEGTALQPVDEEYIGEELQEFIGSTVADGIRLIGIRTGEMHLALAAGKGMPDFNPEEFSLHYQRSLFSGILPLLRVSFQHLERSFPELTPEAEAEAGKLFARREEIIEEFKKIYAHKLDVIKTRIHGNFDLNQVLFTGKDIALLNFGGDPTRSYSERRLKRSPLRDVAGIIRSLHYAAYEGLILNNMHAGEDTGRLVPFANLWIRYVTGFFLHHYLETVKDSAIIPDNTEDLNLLLRTYLMEKAFQSLDHELRYRPDWAIIPLRLINGIMDHK